VTPQHLDSAPQIRRATPSDTRAVLGLFDDAVAWLVSIGSAGQWGSEPWSSNPTRREPVTAMMAEAGAWVAVRDGMILGAIVLGEAHDYVPPGEDELYVRLLIASRAAEARGTGATLLRFADDEARRAAVGRLRVDCYAGGEGRLVQFYESCGYVSTGDLMVGQWPGRVLVRDLRPGLAGVGRRAVS
jgi:GNAT superfamily N-acetyltransferase